MMEDPKLKEQAKLLAEEIEVLQKDPELQKQAKLLATHMEEMMSNPKLQDQAKLVAEQMEAAFNLEPVKELNAHRVRESAMVDKLITNLADNMFDKVSQ